MLILIMCGYEHKGICTGHWQTGALSISFATSQPISSISFVEGWVAKSEGWVAKSVARQLATAVLWVRIQTSLKNHKWAT
jgi:hypothetical protein